MPPKGWKNDPQWVAWEFAKKQRYWHYIAQRQRMRMMQEEIDAQARFNASVVVTQKPQAH